MKLRNLSFTLLVLGTSTLAFVACGDDSETGESGGDPVEITLEAQDELFPGFAYDTGLIPAVSPVQASFTVSASGETKVAATCAVSGSKSKPVLTGLPEGGKITIDGGFAMLGRLVVTGVPGIDDYDGEIPGLENIEIEVVGDGDFDPFAIDDEVRATAAIPASDLPAIPLGSVPGELQMRIGEGSFVEIGWSGTCAGIDSEKATYSGTLARSGKLVIESKVVFDLVVDTLEYEIPSFEIDLALGTTDASASAEVTKLGAAPSKGDKVDSACEGGGEGGAGAGGTQASSGEGSSTSAGTTTSTGASTASGFGTTTGAGPTCETEAECGGAPCVEGTCGNGTGLCGSGLTYESEELTACASESCCSSLAACTFDYSDVDGCNDCVAAGGGPRCNDYLGCVTENCLGGICDSAVGTGDVELDACLGQRCCAEYNTCTQDGADPQSCLDCFDQGGGPLCDEAMLCDEASGC